MVNASRILKRQAAWQRMLGMIHDNEHFEVVKEFIIWKAHPRTRFARGNELHLQRFLDGRQYRDFCLLSRIGAPAIVLPPEAKPVEVQNASA